MLMRASRIAAGSGPPAKIHFSYFNPSPRQDVRLLDGGVAEWAATQQSPPADTPVRLDPSRDRPDFFCHRDGLAFPMHPE